jgi:hypothetical protein
VFDFLCGVPHDKRQWENPPRFLDQLRLADRCAEQPCLIINDLKLDPKTGGIALRVGPGTEGCFSNLKITAE